MLSDPIAAVATPVGRSAIALIRVSGDGAFEIAGRVLAPFAVDPERTARRSHAVGPDTSERLDDVLYLTYRNPASYTGQDVVEITTHGGLLTPPEVLGALLSAGARLASPGEFTRRALLNGKLDLLQAEAVGDLVDATAAAQRRAALHQLDRGLSHQIEALRTQLLDLEALISYDIDFPEEDDGAVHPERIDAGALAVHDALTGLASTAAEGERLREGALAVIAGRPNAGKSSLFNALLGRDRAIVTELPGTTRDAIEAPAVCGGFPFRLIDTAGLRETSETVERLGVEVSRRYLDNADIVLFCAEHGRALTEEECRFVDQMSAPVIVIRTKSDLFPDDATANYDDVVVSAISGNGLGALRAQLAERAFTHFSGHEDMVVVVTRERHRVAIRRALDEVREFRAAREKGSDAAVAATHLRTAVLALEDLIGPIQAEDILDRVFSSFCVGK